MKAKQLAEKPVEAPAHTAQANVVAQAPAPVAAAPVAQEVQL